jgi:hypothetical protein
MDTKEIDNKGYASAYIYNRIKIEKRDALRRAIEARQKARVERSLKLRYVGLVLVQGSSGLALLNYPMINYWVALWFGLLCYQLTAVVFYKEDNRVYQSTLEKFNAGMGSNQDTINALAVKRKREIVYIIGNSIGLVLIGINIIQSI